jgi:putative molybdenum carrier protein
MEIWSGGQTGVDRAALDAALDSGLRIGGWIPKGRLAEDGLVPLRYAALREAGTPDYRERTRLNVRDTDATLVLSWGEPRGGTRETLDVTRELDRPVLTLDLATADSAAAARIRDWLESLDPVRRLNVAGPRASQVPLAYDRAREILRIAFDTVGGANQRAGEPTR